MTPRPVRAVFIWRADKTAAFKAVYGRLGGSGYTKDFHQPIGEQARALERVMDVLPGSETDVEWRWPGGHYTNGKLHPAADYPQNGRMNLRWPTDQPPPTWRLTQNPTSDTIETLKGQPGSKNIAEADAQLAAVVASGERPWFVAVNLVGEGPVLHARLVLQSPGPGRDYASWDNLPRRVRQAMNALPANRAGDVVEFEEGVPVRAGAIVKRILEAFEENPNVLIVGPPGTGKTVATDDIRQMYEEGVETATFDPAVLHGAFSEGENSFAGETRVRSLVFHPSYAYEDFVIGLLPEPVEGEGGGVTVRPCVGPLLDLAHFASQPDRRALLICDEFNRGAAAAIFGDTLALLDGDKRSTPGKQWTGATIDTPYYRLDPETPDGEPLDELTSLPSTLYILAAMNSADRSVAPLDAALRRRFAIIHVGPDYDVLRNRLGIPEDFELGARQTWDEPEHVSLLAVKILEALNERIEVVLGRDFLLGHSVMWGVGGETYEAALRSLAVAMDNRVMGTLALSFVDNDAAFAAVLNVGGSEDEPSTDRAAGSWHQPSEAVRQVAAPRLRPVWFQSLSDDDLAAALESLLG